MAEFNFYFNEKDEIDFINHVFEFKMYVVPDMHYKEKIYRKIFNIDEYLSYRSISRLFYLIHDDYIESDLIMFDLGLEKESVFAIMQKEGGPYINFLSSNIYDKDNSHYLSLGMIGIYSKYYSKKKNRMLEVPSELKYYYNKLKKYIICNSIKAKVNLRYVYIGNNAMKDIENGIICI